MRAVTLKSLTKPWISIEMPHDSWVQMGKPASAEECWLLHGMRPSPTQELRMVESAMIWRMQLGLRALAEPPKAAKEQG